MPDRSKGDDDPHKKGYLGLPGWEFGAGLTTPPRGGGGYIYIYIYESRAKDKAGLIK
jgi:hypothetical protein